MEDKELRDREQFELMIKKECFPEMSVISQLDALIDLMQEAHDMDKWVHDEPPSNNKAVWAMHRTLGSKLLIPCVAYYSNDDIEVYDADEEPFMLKKGWYTIESQDSGDFEETYREANIACWKPIDYEINDGKV